MKSLTQHINEKLVLTKKLNKHTLFPETKEELVDMIKDEISKNGNECSLNHIDVSQITDMSKLFYNSRFNGDISQWDVSNVEDMNSMFESAESFNQPIGDWDISKVKNMGYMFWSANKFNQDISKWRINRECRIIAMFGYCPIGEKYKPKLL